MLTQLLSETSTILGFQSLLLISKPFDKKRKGRESLGRKNTGMLMAAHPVVEALEDEAEEASALAAEAVAAETETTKEETATTVEADTTAETDTMAEDVEATTETEEGTNPL